MLRKLLKYEIQRSAKRFLPLVLGYFVVSILISVVINIFDGNSFSSVGLDVIPVLLIILYIGLTVALFIMDFFMSVSNFNKTLFTDEGYLMLTIPVKERNHIFTKLISSVIWMTASIVVFIISLCIIDTDVLGSLSNFVEVVVKSIHEEPLLMLLLFILTIVTFAVGQLFFYFLVSASNLFKRKALAGLIIIVCSYTISSVTGTMFNKMMDNAVGLGVYSIFNNNSITDINVILLCYTAYQLFYGVIFYLLTNFVVTKKFNLQ